MHIRLGWLKVFIIACKSTYVQTRSNTHSVGLNHQGLLVFQFRHGLWQQITLISKNRFPTPIPAIWNICNTCPGRGVGIHQSIRLPIALNTSFGCIGGRHSCGFLCNDLATHRIIRIQHKRFRKIIIGNLQNLFRLEHQIRCAVHPS